jgi:hypothetical protein
VIHVGRHPLAPRILEATAVSVPLEDGPSCPLPRSRPSGIRWHGLEVVAVARTAEAMASPAVARAHPRRGPILPARSARFRHIPPIHHPIPAPIRAAPPPAHTQSLGVTATPPAGWGGERGTDGGQGAPIASRIGDRQSAPPRPARLRSPIGAARGWEGGGSWSGIYPRRPSLELEETERRGWRRRGWRGELPDHIETSVAIGGLSPAERLPSLVQHDRHESRVHELRDPPPRLIVTDAGGSSGFLRGARAHAPDRVEDSSGDRPLIALRCVVGSSGIVPPRTPARVHVEGVH